MLFFQVSLGIGFFFRVDAERWMVRCVLLQTWRTSCHFLFIWRMWFANQCWDTLFFLINPPLHKAKLAYRGFGLCVRSLRKGKKNSHFINKKNGFGKNMYSIQHVSTFPGNDGKLVKSSCRYSQEILTWISPTRFWWIKSNDIYPIFQKCSGAGSSSSHCGIALELKASTVQLMALLLNYEVFVSVLWSAGMQG